MFYITTLFSTFKTWVLNIGLPLAVVFIAQRCVKDDYAFSTFKTWILNIGLQLAVVFEAQGCVIENYALFILSNLGSQHWLSADCRVQSAQTCYI